MYTKIQRFVFLVAILAALLLLTAGLTSAKDAPLTSLPLRAPVGTGFTYQGQLVDGGAPAAGNFDLQFELYDAEMDGNLLGAVTLEDVAVADGIFTVLLDFGAGAFDGQARWLAIRVRPGSETGDYTLLEPRQPLTAAPYAQYALEAGRVAWKNVGQNPIPANCAQGETLAWDVNLSTWKCAQNTDNAYTAGFGLALEGTEFNILTDTVQVRIAGACAVGSTIRLIYADGRVECDVDSPLNRSLAPSDNAITTVDSAADVGSFTSVTIGIDGLPVISYYDSGNSDLKVAHCNDIACRSAALTTVDTTGIVGDFVNSIAIGSDGLPIISYHDGTNFDLKVAHCNDVTCSSAITTTLVMTGSVGEYSSIAIGADGLPIISYRDGSATALRIAHCDDVICGSATVNTLDAGTGIGYSTSIAIGTDGLPIVSYRDNFNANLKAAHCNDVLCSSVTINTLDTVGEVGYSTSIAIGVDGLPVISYRDNTNDDLKVAHCNDVICGSATANAIDTTGDIGLYTSITIGADGLPMISYRDDTNTALKVAHCHDIRCSSATSTVVDGLENVGEFTAISIGVDGLPVISYFDMINSDLKVIHCSNTFCVPFWRQR